MGQKMGQKIEQKMGQKLSLKLGSKWVFWQPTFASFLLHKNHFHQLKWFFWIFSFLYRLDSKRSSKSGQDYFLVEATGDMLENKPILKSDENDVGERSCDLIHELTSKYSAGPKPVGAEGPEGPEGGQGHCVERGFYLDISGETRHNYSLSQLKSHKSIFKNGIREKFRK